MPYPSDMAPSGDRLPQLDGLRGIAALIVVVHHGMLVSPGLAQYYGQTRPSLPGPLSWFGFTPLHLLWDGPAAVTVFFVLSGLVLTLPFQRESPPPWHLYYPRRLLRLYLPTVCAVVLALTLFMVFPRRTSPEFSWWVNAHAFAPTAMSVLADAALLFGTDWLNSPLWSLRWEVVFSLALPVYLFLGRLLQAQWLLTGVALVALHSLGVAQHNDFLRYLPVFGLGVLMGFRRQQLGELANRVPRWLWPILSATALILLNAPWLPVLLTYPTALVALGATMLVFVFQGWEAAATLARSRVVRWLGLLSFSLYLVHEPVIVSVVALTGSPSPLVALGLGVPLSLLAAYAFRLLVEQPSHRLSKSIGQNRAPTGQSR